MRLWLAKTLRKKTTTADSWISVRFNIFQWLHGKSPDPKYRVCRLSGEVFFMEAWHNQQFQMRTSKQTLVLSFLEWLWRGRKNRLYINCRIQFPTCSPHMLNQTYIMLNQSILLHLWKTIWAFQIDYGFGNRKDMVFLW